MVFLLDSLSCQSGTSGNMFLININNTEIENKCFASIMFTYFYPILLNVTYMVNRMIFSQMERTILFVDEFVIFTT